MSVCHIMAWHQICMIWASSDIDYWQIYASLALAVLTYKSTIGNVPSHVCIYGLIVTLTPGFAKFQVTYVCPHDYHQECLRRQSLPSVSDNTCRTEIQLCFNVIISIRYTTKFVVYNIIWRSYWKMLDMEIMSFTTVGHSPHTLWLIILINIYL